MNFLLYLLQVHIALSLLFIVYKALSTRNTHFTARRVLLLGILLFALVYPLFRLPGAAGMLPAELQITLPELQVKPGGTGGRPLSVYQILAGVYGCIALMLGLRLAVRLLSIVGLRRHNPLRRLGSCRVVVCPEGTQPCSFFNWIFLPASALDNPTGWTTIVNHEQAHVRQMHSIDILLGESVAALCWINPLAWLLLKELRLNLEYLADRAALTDETEKRPYQYRLLELAGADRAPRSTLPFNHAFLKERIAMINRQRSSRGSLCRYLLALPLFGLLVVGSQSCRQSTAPETANAQSMPPATAEALPRTTTAHERPEQGPVFEEAEVMPEFPGGTPALFEFISRHLQYPQEAIDNQTEGRVVLQFVVDKEGKVSNIQVKRSIDPALDQAAIDVIRTLPDWKPGMQNGQPVNVRYTLPVVFKLS